MIYHVYPVNDLKEHNTDIIFCHCEPKLEAINDNLLVIHNSYDGREIIENMQVCMN